MDRNQGVAASTMSKVRWRILPYIFVLFVISYLDRANIGYAALDMNKALGISSAAFGLVSSIFFIGYFLCEVPSNIMLYRFGARKWIARILFSWGVCACAMTLVQGVNGIYIIRFLLGCAEAGLVPGVIFYLSSWFPERERARAIATFFIAIPVSLIIGSPVSTWIMDHVHWFGISGWRWLFVLEGLPAIICGVVTLVVLPDRPQQVTWLDGSERDWLLDELRKEQEANQSKERRYSIWQTFKVPQVWWLAGVYGTANMGAVAIVYWMPQIVRGFSSILTNTQIGLIVMVPWIITAIAGFAWGRHSDRTGERWLHMVIPTAVAIFGFGLAVVADATVLKMIGLTLVIVGNLSMYGPFWAVPSVYLSEQAAAVGIAIINSVTQLSVFAALNLTGYLNGAYGMNLVFAFLGLTLVACLVLILVMPRPPLIRGR
jgi:ACS family tartrate transporter-like MFS transporter